MPKDEQIAEVFQQRRPFDSRHFLGERRQLPEDLGIGRGGLDPSQILGHEGLLMSEHQEDERGVEARDVLLREIIDVDDPDEVDEQLDLRVKVGDEGEKSTLLDGVARSQLLAVLVEVLEGEDEGADEHVRVDEALIDGGHELLRGRLIDPAQDDVEFLEGLGRGERRDEGVRIRGK